MEDIRKKYSDDMDTINKYMETVKSLLFSLCNTTDDLVSELPCLYQSIRKLEFVNDYSSIQNEIIKFKEKIEKEMHALCEIEYENSKISPNDPTADGDLLLYLLNEISDGNKDRENLFKSSQSVLEALCITKGPLIHGDRFYELYDNSEEVYHLIDIALNNSAYMQTIKLGKKLEIIKQIEKSIELFNLHGLMNIYRQCFIQIMSYFDNCIFELMKTYMQRDYFYWLDKFKNSSIKTHEMAQYTSFEDFKDWHIDDILKGYSVKDLLEILHKRDSAIFKKDGLDIYREIQEFIARRNVHVHNNGIVDKAYITRISESKKIEGEFLIINENVVNRVQFLTKMIVDNIAFKFIKENI